MNQRWPENIKKEIDPVNQAPALQLCHELIQMLSVRDTLKLRQASKTLSLCFTDDVIITMIKIGSLEKDLRLAYWVSQASYYDFEKELKKKFHITSVFISVYDHVKKNVKAENEI